MLERLKKQGLTILVSTPYMDEANLCDRIALIEGGKILSIDTPQNIVKSYPGNLYALKSDKMYKLLLDLRQYKNIESAFAFGEFVHASFKNNVPDIKSGTQKFLEEKGNTNVEIKMIEPTIEDCFISLLKK
jgi:ABC-2 type transport system ATP-binding protein